jgi:hypothetical protein
MAPEMRDMACEERGQLMHATSATSGVVKPWLVAQGEPWPGSAVVGMRQRSPDALLQCNMARRGSCRQLTGMRVPRYDLQTVLSVAKPTPLPWHESMPRRDPPAPG